MTEILREVIIIIIGLKFIQNQYHSSYTLTYTCINRIETIWQPVFKILEWIENQSTYIMNMFICKSAFHKFVKYKKVKKEN